MSDTPKSFRVGLVQMCAGRTVDRNIAAATELIRAAARGGAQYVQTPEMTNILELDRERLLAAIKPEADDPGVTQFRFLARELGIWLHVGSLALVGERGRPVNRSLLISPEGRIDARYDKITCSTSTCQVANPTGRAPTTSPDARLSLPRCRGGSSA